MTKDSLDRIKLYVENNRKESVIAATNCRLNGYTSTALKHENEAAFASLILKDISEEEHVTST